MKNKIRLEEAAKSYAKIPLHRDVDSEERYFNDAVREYDAFKDGAEWMQERMYSEEEVITLLESLVEHPTKPGYKRKDILKVIEQFKKK